MAERGYAQDEQDLWIAQASKNVKKCAFYMRKAIVSIDPKMCPKKHISPAQFHFFFLIPVCPLLKVISTLHSPFSLMINHHCLFPLSKY